MRTGAGSPPTPRCESSARLGHWSCSSHSRTRRRAAWASTYDSTDTVEGSSYSRYAKLSRCRNVPTRRHGSRQRRNQPRRGRNRLASEKRVERTPHPRPPSAATRWWSWWVRQERSPKMSGSPPRERGRPRGLQTFDICLIPPSVRGLGILSVTRSPGRVHRPGLRHQPWGGRCCYFEDTDVDDSLSARCGKTQPGRGK